MRSSIILPIGVLCAIGVIWLMNSDDGIQSAEPAAKSTVPAEAVVTPMQTTALPAPTQHPSASMRVAASTFAAAISPDQEPAPVPEYDLRQAMAMMQESAARGDPRQPELIPRAAEIVPPDAVQPPDPQRYAERETRQDRAAIAAYAQILQQLPVLRARVAQARTDPRRSTQDYQQAKEALEQLEQMRARLAHEHPELLP